MMSRAIWRWKCRNRYVIHKYKGSKRIYKRIFAFVADTSISAERIHCDGSHNWSYLWFCNKQYELSRFKQTCIHIYIHTCLHAHKLSCLHHTYVCIIRCMYVFVCVKVALTDYWFDNLSNKKIVCVIDWRCSDDSIRNSLQTLLKALFIRILLDVRSRCEIFF